MFYGAHLTKRNTPDDLKNGAMAGAFFEDFVVSEIVKSYYNKGILDLTLYFYCDRDMNKIDLLIEENGKKKPKQIEELTVSNEELAASNEELAAYNEALLAEINRLKRQFGEI